jgi:hypothetical protein
LLCCCVMLCCTIEASYGFSETNNMLPTIISPLSHAVPLPLGDEAIPLATRKRKLVNPNFAGDSDMNNLADIFPESWLRQTTDEKQSIQYVLSSIDMDPQFNRMRSSEAIVAKEIRVHLRGIVAVAKSDLPKAGSGLKLLKSVQQGSFSCPPTAQYILITHTQRCSFPIG